MHVFQKQPPRRLSFLAQRRQRGKGGSGVRNRGQDGGDAAEHIPAVHEETPKQKKQLQKVPSK